MMRYTIKIPDPWKVRRKPGTRHTYQVCSYERPDMIEVLTEAWSDPKEAQAFADAANALYNVGRQGREAAA